MPTLAGALWLWWAAQGGALGALLGGLPGPLLLATGLSNLLWAGDARIFHFMSLGAILGILFAFPAIAVFGPVAAAVLLVLSAGSFVAAGRSGAGPRGFAPTADASRYGYQGGGGRALDVHHSPHHLAPFGRQAGGAHR